MRAHSSLFLSLTLVAIATLRLGTPARAQDDDETDSELEQLEQPEPPAPEPEPAPATSGSRAPDRAAFGDDDGVAGSESATQARAHFEKGVEYYAEGDYRAALIELQRAYGLHKTYKLLYNLGQVADELRDYAGAERYFRDYLAKGGSELAPERRREVQQELARLRGRVASLHLHANQPDAHFRVEDRDIMHPQGGVRVSAGRRKVRAEKAGFAPVERSIDVTGGEELDVELKFAPPLVASAGAGGQARASSSRLPWVTGILAAGLGVASGAVGFAAYRDVSARDDALTRYTPREQLDSMASRAHTKALIADSLLGAAVVSAVVTTVLVLSGGEQSEPRARASALRAPGPGVEIAF